MKRCAAGRLFDDRGRHDVAVPRGSEDLRHLERLLEDGLLTVRPLGSECGNRRRARIDVVRAAVANCVQLTCSTVVAAVELPVEHDRGTETSADEQEGEVRNAL